MGIVSGCVLPGEKNEIEDKLIKKNVSELVLTLEDVGDGWFIYRGGLWSKEQGTFVDYRYSLGGQNYIFSNITDVKSKFNDLGDEAFFVMDRVHGAVFFRYRNVVAHLQILDFDENLVCLKKKS